MPHIIHLDSYVHIIANGSELRRAIFTAQKLMNECLLEAAPLNEILSSHLAEIQDLSQSGGAGKAIANLPSIRESGSKVVEVEFRSMPVIRFPKSDIGLDSDPELSMI